MSIVVGSLQEGFMTFEEFEQIRESVGPVSVKYGTNMNFDDANVIQTNDDFIHTFFIFDNKLYDVQLHPNGTIGFGTSLTIPSTEEELYVLKFTDSKTDTDFPTGVFNRALYVLLELFKTYKRKKYTFVSANNKLFRFYSILFKNELFKEKMGVLGYDLDLGIVNNQVIFSVKRKG